ncbi:hypothetical protein [Streptomyces sp. NPDC006691]|uniref:hypothetical protein n=1 Tax=Streptomyces sp. NPDC006691 TaxID=3364757 RepID=UPI0036A92E58
MSFVERMAGSNDETEARQPVQRGTTSLVLGTVAVALMACPWLPSSLPPWVRFPPVYFIVPAGIAAVVSGIAALRRMRDREGTDRFRARAGVALGTTAIVIPLAVIVWAIWALGQAYQ